MASPTVESLQDALELPTCSYCSAQFLLGDTILTAVDCGHSFHHDLACTRERQRLQGYTGLPVFKSVCPVPACQNRDATITLFFRNAPLENVVTALTSTRGTAGKVDGTRKVSPSPPAGKRAKRVRLGSPSTTTSSSGVGQQIETSRRPSSVEQTAQQTINELNLPDLPPVEDSDPEEDDHLLAKIAEADRLRQQTMYNGGDGDLSEDEADGNLKQSEEDEEHDVAEETEESDLVPIRLVGGIRAKAIPDNAYELDTPELPPGLPPSSQWRRPLTDKQAIR